MSSESEKDNTAGKPEKEELKNLSVEELDRLKKEREIEKLDLEKEKLKKDIENSNKPWFENILKNNLVSLLSIIIACGTLYITYTEKIVIPTEKNEIAAQEEKEAEAIALLQFLDTLKNEQAIPIEIFQIAERRPDLLERMVEKYIEKRHDNNINFIKILKRLIENNPKFEFVSVFSNLYCSEKYSKFKNETDHSGLNRLFYECFPSQTGKERFKLFVKDVQIKLLPDFNYLTDTLIWDNG